MSKLAVLHSAETYVEEPGDLWTEGLPRRLRTKAFRLVPAAREYARAQRSGPNGDRDGFIWVRPNGRFLANREEARRRDFDGTTARGLLASLDRDGIGGAVLYPSVAAQAYSVWRQTGVLDTFLDVYNDWLLALAAEAPRRLRAIALLNVDDPEAAALAMPRFAEQGAAGFVVPCAPGEGCRYDQPRYEVLWRAAADVGLPLSLLAGAHRHVDSKSSDEEAAPRPTLATQLAFKATSVFPARRSVTAITYAGVFERYPELRAGVVGFGAGWAAYAMVRADEMYDVRPERTGPPTRVPGEFDEQVATLHLERDAGMVIAGDERSGTKGMAPEGVGFHFKPGERFSDHFRRNVFLTFDGDDLDLALRGFLSTGTMLWGQGRFASDDGSLRDRLEGVFGDLSDDDRSSLAGANAAGIYGFNLAPAGVGGARSGREVP